MAYSIFLINLPKLPLFHVSNIVIPGLELDSLHCHKNIEWFGKGRKLFGCIEV